MRMFLLFPLLMSFSFSISGEEITNDSFKGKWCGKWDSIYSTCITINNIESGSIAKYQWLEHPNGKFKKSEKMIERINRNTLKIGNIWFVLDEKDLKNAIAMGVFKRQSRLSNLTKEDN